MGELLAADVLVAAGSATLITPAVMIFDRYGLKYRARRDQHADAAKTRRREILL
jgi:hypothetical protein